MSEIKIRFSTKLDMWGEEECGVKGITNYIGSMQMWSPISSLLKPYSFFKYLAKITYL